MADSEVSTSKSSKRPTNVLEIRDPNPKPSKIPKIPAANPINEPEEGCRQAHTHLEYNFICANIASCAMEDDKEIVGKDKDLTTPAHEQELIPRAMSDEEDHEIDIQTVDKDRDSKKGTYPSYSPSEVCSEADYVYSLICGPVASSAMSDGKEIVGKDKDSAYKTSATTPINEPDVACSKADLIYKIKSATIVLDYYNNKNDTRFELVEDETLASYPSCKISGIFIHCVFNAKEDSSIKKFFAIIQYVRSSGPVVTTCKILEGDTKVDCELCRLAVSHEVVKDYIPDPPTFRPVPNFDGLEFMKRNRKKAFERVANRSLDHYNKINGTNFVVEEAETICCCAFSGDWIHCCFDAVDSSIKQLNHDDSPTKLFFAEIKYDTSSDPVVTNCKIVQGETKVGCENCNSVTHPVDGYRGSFLATSEIVEKSEKVHHYQYYRVYCKEFLAIQAGLAPVSDS